MHYRWGFSVRNQRKWLIKRDNEFPVWQEDEDSSAAGTSARREVEVTLATGLGSRHVIDKEGKLTKNAGGST